MPLDSICEIAYDAHVPEEMVRSIVYDYGLFKVTKKEFYSERICFELADKETRSSAAQKSANARWNKYKKEKELTESNNAIQDAVASENDADNNAFASESDAKNKVKLNKEKEDTDVSPVPESGNGELFTQDQQAEISVKDFVAVWNNEIAESGAPLQRIDYAVLSEKQREKVRLRIKEMAKVGSPLDVLGVIMRKACGSRFCTGQTNSGWLLKFGWLILNGNNWRKVYQGEYDDRATNTGCRAGRPGRLHVTATSAKDYEEDF